MKSASIVEIEAVGDRLLLAVKVRTPDDARGELVPGSTLSSKTRTKRMSTGDLLDPARAVGTLGHQARPITRATETPRAVPHTAGPGDFRGSEDPRFRGRPWAFAAEEVRK